MSRDMAIFGTIIVALPLVYASCFGAANAAAQRVAPTHQAEFSAMHLSYARSSHGLVRGEAQMPAMTTARRELSPQENQVRQIAERNGDKEYLMVDKALGEIILFEASKPVFIGPALTGAAEGDLVPPIVLTFSAFHSMSTEQKVTPAGRFTVRPEFDPEYGRVWTINEIHGKDWDFAIHQVYLGAPSEHRDQRLRSPNALDRHVTLGCINVERNTIQFFTQKLPRRSSVPLYILPQNDGLTSSLFPPRNGPRIPNGVVK